MRTILFFVTCGIFFSSCVSSLMKTPKDVGDKAFNIIKTFDNLSEEDYIKQMVKLKDLKKITGNKDIFSENGIIELINSITQEKMTKLLKVDKYFAAILEDGKNNNIDWSQVEFSKFEHVIKGNDGIKNMCKGKLYFNHKGKEYHLKIEAINMGDYYEFWLFKKLRS
ncbi:MAG: hypothetical protein GY810_25850 [Aureispira sp.]|nr:hypothetical protein [Aureispira sp.]